ncbi:MAG: sulfurtransferase [Gammaproteobacteria bacterium]|nr:sulfurtransferase [Gammaproteobacteria bacterium]MAY03714.1 sulfurtransferase [Gammaproteobacteria bacterium]|tara:strand:- start:391 stop:804 length:414 start_codon:yes stop_codon:yes gene_type:complete
MARFLEFLGNHWILTSLWLVIFFVLVAYLKKKAGKAVGTHEATRMINHDDGIVVDIRDKKSFDKGHIVDAVNIPLAKLDERITELDKHKEKPMIVVCQMGHQSGEALRKLETKGHTRVYRMSGGIAEWQSQGLPLVS